MTVDIYQLTDSKWLALLKITSVRLRRFVGSRDDCESVKTEWLAGDFKRGTETQAK